MQKSLTVVKGERQKVIKAIKKSREMTLRLLREFIIHFKSDHKSDEQALFVGEIRFNMKQLFNIKANMIAIQHASRSRGILVKRFLFVERKTSINFHKKSRSTSA